MPGDFRIRVEPDVVIVVETGTLDFATSNRAVVAGIEAALAGKILRIAFDVRDADLSNYYSYIVRHAEMAGEMGLDTRYRIAVVGNADAADVLSFIEMVARNRGLTARSFLDFDAAMAWLRSAAG